MLLGQLSSSSPFQALLVRCNHDDLFWQQEPREDLDYRTHAVVQYDYLTDYGGVLCVIYTFSLRGTSKEH